MPRSRNHFRMLGGQLHLRCQLAAVLFVFSCTTALSSTIWNDGAWSGYIVPVAKSVCPALKKRVTGQVSNRNLTLLLIDGWENHRQAVGTIQTNGMFHSNEFKWAYLVNGWQDAASFRNNIVVGHFEGEVFQGIIYSPNGGKNCDSIIYMAKGVERLPMYRMKEKIQREADRFLTFEDIRFNITSPQSTTDSSMHGITENPNVPVNNETSAGKSIAEKLLMLKKLLEKGLITLEEAAQKRKAILEEL